MDPEPSLTIDEIASTSPLNWTQAQLRTIADHIAALQADPTPLNISGITELLGVSSPLTWRWHNATRQYLAGVENRWPPPAATGRAPIKTQREAADDAAAITSWPPDPSVLPPYDDPVNERWRTGTIVAWAMRVGRMDVTGRPVRPRQRPGLGRVGARLPVSLPTRQQLDRLRELAATDERRIAASDLPAALNVSRAKIDQALRPTHAYLHGALTSWPPPSRDRTAQLLVAASASQGAGITSWPPHPQILPPPSHIGERPPRHLYRQLWFRAGDLWLWLAQTGRPLDVVLRLAEEWRPA